MSPEHVPVLIVGAGPVGVVAATLLAQRGVASVILERHDEPYPLPRAVHLDDEVYAIVRGLGLAGQFAAISRPMPGMRLLDAGHRTLAEFSREPGAGPLGLPQANMFDQPDLERILLDNLTNHPQVELRRGCTVTGVDHKDRGALVHYSDASGEHVIDADAVLGCDGANSTVRAAIGAVMTDLGFRERWLVVDGRTPEPLPVWGGVHQICDPRRPATFMHVTGTRYRWEFRLDSDEDAEALLKPAALARLLAPWLADQPAGYVEIIRSATYIFRAETADRWRRDRIFVLGDAAHQTPPFIGQGLGAGLRDADNLAWKLAGVLTGQLRESVLDTYEAERLPHVTRTIRTAMVVGWAMTGGQDRAARLRKGALGLLWRVPGISAVMLRTASPPLGRSPLVARRRTRRGPGRVCPGAGRDGFTVVSGRRPTPSANAALSDLGIEHIVLPRRRGAILVRPDGIVAAVERGPAALTKLLAVVRSARP